jgi:multimeric flavodoxin WrbA
MEVKMEILAISCSPREQGNTDLLVEQALKGAAQEGAGTKMLFLRDLNILPCDACYACTKAGKCHLNDDMYMIYEAMEKVEGIIIGSPVYFWSVCGPAKIMIDRTYALNYPDSRLANKVGGIVLSASRRGAMNASSMLLYWMISNHMLPADIVDGYATAKGAVLKDNFAMKSSFELGSLMANLIKKRFKYPETFSHPLYRFVQKKYDIANCPIP